MNAEQCGRLLTVAKVLRTQAAPEWFSMNQYLWNSPYREAPCGTPACALGWYAWDRGWTEPFRRMKLGGDFTTAGDWLCAASKHFGLTLVEAYRLFDGQGCDGAKTPIEAARYIEHFISAKLRQQAAEEAEDAEVISS